MYSDFNLVRDVQYKYSKKAEQNFFAKPIENFFMVKYAQLYGEDFISKKIDNMNDKDDNEKTLEKKRYLERTNNLAKQGISVLKEIA